MMAVNSPFKSQWRKNMPEIQALTNPLVTTLTIFVLASFVGYYVVWKVTPALHTPLMSVTNAISSIIIIGALIATGSNGSTEVSLLGGLAIFITAINIFGGFVVTHRMLRMYKK